MTDLILTKPNDMIPGQTIRKQNRVVFSGEEGGEEGAETDGAHPPFGKGLRDLHSGQICPLLSCINSCEIVETSQPANLHSYVNSLKSLCFHSRRVCRCEFIALICYTSWAVITSCVHYNF